MATVLLYLMPLINALLMQSLRMLFTSKDLSKVKAYVEAQWTKILSNRVSIQDFVFAREVRCSPR